MIFFWRSLPAAFFSTKIFSPVKGFFSVQYIRVEYVDGVGVNTWACSIVVCSSREANFFNFFMSFS